MKKLIITAAVSSGLALSGFAQGYANFQNTISTQFYFTSTASTANKISSAALGGQSATVVSGSAGVLDVGLYWSTSAFTDAAQGTLAGIVNIGATAGTLLGNGSLTFGPTTSPNETVYVQVFAWDSTYATPDAAHAAGGAFGASSAGQVNSTYGAVGAPLLMTLGAAAPAPGGVIFGTAAPFFPRTIVLAGPEPGTIAIGGLGAAALMLFRRRRK